MQPAVQEAAQQLQAAGLPVQLLLPQPQQAPGVAQRTLSGELLPAAVRALEGHLRGLSTPRFNALLALPSQRLHVLRLAPDIQLRLQRAVGLAMQPQLPAFYTSLRAAVEAALAAAMSQQQATEALEQALEQALEELQEALQEALPGVLEQLQAVAEAAKKAKQGARRAGLRRCARPLGPGWSHSLTRLRLCSGRWGPPAPCSRGSPVCRRAPRARQRPSTPRARSLAPCVAPRCPDALPPCAPQPPPRRSAPEPRN